jgi:hypothetical protein
MSRGQGLLQDLLEGWGTSRVDMTHLELRIQGGHAVLTPASTPVSGSVMDSSVDECDAGIAAMRMVEDLQSRPEPMPPVLVDAIEQYEGQSASSSAQQEQPSPAAPLTPADTLPACPQPAAPVLLNAAEHYEGQSASSSGQQEQGQQQQPSPAAPLTPEEKARILARMREIKRERKELARQELERSGGLQRLAEAKREERPAKEAWQRAQARHDHFKEQVARYDEQQAR